MSEDFNERARRRSATWGSEAIDADGKQVASNGVSTELLRPLKKPEDGAANVEAYVFFLAALDPRINAPRKRSNVSVTLGFRSAS